MERFQVRILAGARRWVSSRGCPKDKENQLGPGETVDIRLPGYPIGDGMGQHCFIAISILVLIAIGMKVNK